MIDVQEEKRHMHKIDAKGVCGTIETEDECAFYFVCV